ncbi:aspartate/glutamate racemase family protein [bacterium]|nr:aspartate/glutamate racemase family protein [bacterium]
MIGILGGMGPQAGVDLASKIISQTRAEKDQDHIPLLLVGDPLVPDRTAFLFGRTDINPALAMAKSVKMLIASGAKCIGIACNTAHSPPIFDVFERSVKEAYPDANVLHLIQETVRGIQAQFPLAGKIGILATQGSYEFRLYDNPLSEAGFSPLRPTNTELLTDAIFNPKVGIKACSAPPTSEARSWIISCIDNLIDQGAEAIILGCTELPLAVPESSHRGVSLIDPGLMLARALIEACAPDRLLP